MIKDFQSFINESELNENPAIAAALGGPAAAEISKKIGEGKGLEPGECVSLIKESAGIYEADDDDNHTAEGYIKEIVDSLQESGVVAGIKDVALKSAAAKGSESKPFKPQ